MKSKNHVALMLAAAVLALGGATSATPAGNEAVVTRVANSTLKPGKQLHIVVAKDGTGPMCMPSTGCGYR